jgi:hypothetical protein
MAHVFHRQAVPVTVAAAAAVAAVAVAVVLLLAAGGERASAPNQHGPAAQTLNPAAGIRYDGGPDEGTRGVVPARAVVPAQGTRYDGGPEEGTADLAAPNESALRGPGLRTD